MVIWRAINNALAEDGRGGRATFRAANLIGALTGFAVMFLGLKFNEPNYIRVGGAYMLLSCFFAMLADESRFNDKELKK